MKTLMPELLDKIPTKYFEAKVVELKFTPLNHILLSCVECKSIKFFNEIISKSKPFPNIMNFVIPRRRTRLYQETLKMELNKTYILKLQEETLSKKFFVCEIFDT